MVDVLAEPSTRQLVKHRWFSWIFLTLRICFICVSCNVEYLRFFESCRTPDK